MQTAVLFMGTQIKKQQCPSCGKSWQHAVGMSTNPRSKGLDCLPNSWELFDQIRQTPYQRLSLIKSRHASDPPRLTRSHSTVGWAHTSADVTSVSNGWICSTPSSSSCGRFALERVSCFSEELDMARSLGSHGQWVGCHRAGFG
ncbi:uncharacterized protein LOC144330144 [Macaca mulatta]